MALQINSWEEMCWVSEEVDDTGAFRHTALAAVQDDMIYFGQLNKPKADLVLERIVESLDRIPDEDIFPPWQPDLHMTEAPQELPPDVFIKRPKMSLYDIFLENKVVHLLREGLIEEAEVLEVLMSQPHPNIVGYHGCRVRRGYLTGLAMDRHPHDLERYVETGHVVEDKDLFMASLTSAIRHLHSLGYAHNDLNPRNILIATDGRPVLVDFGSSRKIGEKLSSSRGTKGWIDCEIKDYTTSETQHDLSALTKISLWLDNPTFDS